MTDKQKYAEMRKSDALADLLLLRERLTEEKEWELLKKISICQCPLTLKCVICDTLVGVKQRCKRKWCPSCSRALAAQRSAELGFIVERFRRPLFVTLTMKNVEDLSSGGVRHLRRSFGKLRHRKFWKKTVAAGIATVEVTNIGNGWHPHLHCVLDCRWLAITVVEPMNRDTLEEKKAKYKAAAVELERNWAKCLGQETASVKVKRANGSTIAKEVLKYTVKSEDLINCQGSVGDVIRALESTRLMTTFGTAHGSKVSQLRNDSKIEMKKKQREELADVEPRCTCGAEEFLPQELVNRQRERSLSGLELGEYYRNIDRPKCEAKKPK